MFEYHPNTGIIFTFVPYDTRFLHYRQISFYRSRIHRQSLRHLFRRNSWIRPYYRNDNLLSIRQFNLRHLFPTCLRHLRRHPRHALR
jgi:hypothetical protein